MSDPISDELNTGEIDLGKKNIARSHAQYALEEHLRHTEAEAQAILNHPKRTITDFKLIEVIAPMLKEDLPDAAESFFEQGVPQIPDCKQVMQRLIDRFPENPVIINQGEEGARVYEAATNISRGLVGSLVRSKGFLTECEDKLNVTRDFFLADPLYSLTAQLPQYHSAPAVSSAINSYGNMLGDPRAQLGLAFVAAVLLFTLHRPLKRLTRGIMSTYCLFGNSCKPESNAQPASPQIKRLLS